MEQSERIIELEEQLNVANQRTKELVNQIRIQADIIADLQTPITYPAEWIRMPHVRHQRHHATHGQVPGVAPSLSETCCHAASVLDKCKSFIGPRVEQRGKHAARIATHTILTTTVTGVTS
ncbi:hypothetical protein LIER_37616 [Lithospermum erythrorhizon]|uniref:Uncharacterized protein n=1 Tax=Lithospermum erythrorhizon TaxID=34254 RepID=A0AAV3PP86_LITER